MRKRAKTLNHNMYDQIREDILFIMLYAVVMTIAATASCYLLLRRGNAFAVDITPPLRLRRWTAVFFAVLAVGHLWYIPSIVLKSSEGVMLSILIGALLDCLLTIPLGLVVMLCMLQDRRRPLWPVGVAVAPMAVGVAACIITRSINCLPIMRGYFLLMAVGFTVYMVCSVRQYGRWLRDNFADLEHKEVWQSFIVLAIIMLMFVYYVEGNGGIIYEYIVQVCGFFLICHLLWRVETLSSLTPISKEEESDSWTSQARSEFLADEDVSSTSDDIDRLLRERCEATQLYLQYGLTLSHLAQAIGTNRTYLSQYFSDQNITYNTYINTQRIDHFIRLYREAVAAGQPFTAQQLATRSGYRSYSTFSMAFRQRTGQSVTAWMREA